MRRVFLYIALALTIMPTEAFPRESTVADFADSTEEFRKGFVTGFVNGLHVFATDEPETAVKAVQFANYAYACFRDRGLGPKALQGIIESHVYNNPQDRNKELITGLLAIIAKACRP